MNEKKSVQFSEVVKFLVSGGICFIIQYVLLVILRDKAGLPTLLAFFFAFLIAAVANYILSVLWIWPSAKGSDNATKAGFFITSAIGLGLNELLLWLLNLIFGEDQVLFTLLGREISMYKINACVTAGLVMVWNFFTKRAILNSRLVRKWIEKK